MAQQISCSALHPKDSRTFYNSIYLKSIGYVLPNSYFSESLLNSIQSCAICAFVPKCGYNRNTHRSIIFGPKHLAGAGFTPLYLLQGEGQILQFLKFWRTDTPTSRLLRIAQSWFQYQSGLGQSILTNVHQHLPHIESRWLPSLRLFLSRIKATIELDQDYVPPPQRTRDLYIMDAVLESGLFTSTEVCQINYCRLYLQVTTLSDVCQANGVYIDESFRDDPPSPRSSTSTWLQFNQPRPCNKVWELWKTVLSWWFDSAGIIHRPLGSWLYPANQLRRQWPSYYDSSTDMIYIRTNNVFHQFDRPSQDCIEFSDGTPTDWTPTSTSLPCTLHPIPNDEYILDQDPPKLVPQQSSIQVSATFSDYISDLPVWEQNLFESLDMYYTCFELISIINDAVSTTANDTDKHLISVSDGSAFDRSMSFGWTMSLLNGTRLATCAGPAHGSKQSSFRAEGYGLLSITRFLHHLFEFCQSRPEWKLQLSCDNDPLLKRVNAARPFKTCFPNCTLDADWDIVNMIVRTLHQSSCNIVLPHVKGHQDDKLAYEDLPLDAQLNCDADYEAVYHQTIYAAYRPTVPRMPLNGAQLHIQGATINSGYKTAIRNAFTASALTSQIQQRNNWTLQTMETINLTSHKQAIDRLSARHPQLVKLCHDILPTAKQTNRYNSIMSAECYLCKHDVEDLNHLLRCSHPDRKPWRHTLYKALRATCENHITRPYLVDILLNGIDAWINEIPFDKLEYPVLYHRLIDEQSSLGWRQLFQGRMTSEWARLQDQHLKQLKVTANCHTGTLWTTNIITTIWKEFFTMWNARNTAIHGNDSDTRQQSRIRLATVHLRHLHSKRNDVLATDRDLFIGETDADIDRWAQTRSATHIENWLRIWKPVILDSAKAARAFAIKSVKPIHQYFAPVAPLVPTSRRPPKPRYTTREHTRYDRNQVRKKRPHIRPPANHSITAFFKRRPPPDLPNQLV
jgi:hypothetical protein